LTCLLEDGPPLLLGRRNPLPGSGTHLAPWGGFRRCLRGRFGASTEHSPDIGNLGVYALPLCFEAVQRSFKDLRAEFAGSGHTRAL
jgi:hypothetical protein